MISKLLVPPTEIQRISSDQGFSNIHMHTSPLGLGDAHPEAVVLRPCTHAFADHVTWPWSQLEKRGSSGGQSRRLRVGSTDPERLDASLKGLVAGAAVSTRPGLSERAGGCSSDT